MISMSIAIFELSYGSFDVDILFSTWIVNRLFNLFNHKLSRNACPSAFLFCC